MKSIKTFSFLLLTLSSTAFAFPQYSITKIDFQSLPVNYANGEAKAINASGVVVGGVFSGEFYDYAFRYDGAMHNIGTIAGSSDSYSVAFDINSSGQIVGLSSSSATGGRAFLYDGSMHDLGAFDDYYSEAYAINDSGIVVGRSSKLEIAYGYGDFRDHAFMYDGTMHDLGRGQAVDINNSGKIIINSGDYLSMYLYDGTMHQIGSGGGQVYAINDLDEVVGYLSATQRAFVFKNGFMQDLGTLGGNFSNAVAINNHGDIVGGSATSNDDPYSSSAFLYQNGEMLNLNDLVIGLVDVHLSSANGINDSGQILAKDNSTGYGYILTPISEVPIPSAAWLMGTGLIGLTGIARRKK